ncbi:MAG: hypothetical protein H0X45_12030 [Planctomycetes bacterium]|nr:hypothetical protein [Planctomycetota bacterium]
MSRAKCRDAILAILFIIGCLISAGCRRSNTAGDHTIVLENRSEHVFVCHTMEFEGSVVGGIHSLRPGEKDTSHNHTWQITERVDLYGGIYPNDGTLGTAKFDPKRVDDRTLSCDVLKHMSRSDRQLLWFIVDPDLTLRVVVLPGDRFAAMEKSGERPQ